MRTFYSVLAVASLLAPLAVSSPVAQTLTLEQAVARAVERARYRAHQRVAIAQETEKYLDSQATFRFELRPQLGVFAFSNPALLATSLGSSLFFGKSSVPAWSRANARLDTLAAEVELERAVIQAEMDAARCFFGLVARQQSSAELSQFLEARRAGGPVLEERIRAARATAVDRASWQTGLIDLEWRLEDVQTGRRLAALELAELVGITEAGAELTVVVPVGVASDTPRIEESEGLIETALRHRADARAIRERLERENARLPAGTRVRFEGISLQYAHVNEGAGNALGLSPGEFLLGGNTGRLDLGIAVPLSGKGSNAVMARVTAARLRAIEVEWRELGESLRRDLESLRVLAVSSARKADLASRRMQLAEMIRNAVADRERTGLSSPDAMLAAETELLRNRAEFRTARSEQRTHWYHLKAACGLGEAASVKHGGRDVGRVQRHEIQK